MLLHNSLLRKACMHSTGAKPQRVKSECSPLAQAMEWNVHLECIMLLLRSLLRKYACIQSINPKWITTVCKDLADLGVPY